MIAITDVRCFSKGTAQDLMVISRAFRRRLKQSTSISDQCFDIVEDQTVWSITSSQDPERSYFVVRTRADCSVVSEQTGDASVVAQTHNAALQCVSYKISKSCRYTFSCGCHDYINGSTCKHVLKISSFIGLWNPHRTSFHAIGPVVDYSQESNVENEQFDDVDCFEHVEVPNEDDQPVEQERPSNENSISERVSAEVGQIISTLDVNANIAIV